MCLLCVICSSVFQAGKGQGFLCSKRQYQPECLDAESCGGFSPFLRYLNRSHPPENTALPFLLKVYLDPYTCSVQMVGQRKLNPSQWLGTKWQSDSHCFSFHRITEVMSNTDAVHDAVAQKVSAGCHPGNTQTGKAGNCCLCYRPLDREP